MFVYVWVGLGFFLSLLTSSWMLYNYMNMFFMENRSHSSMKRRTILCVSPFNRDLSFIYGRGIC